MPQTDKTLAFLGMPGYGLQTADAGRAFWRARRDMRGVVNDYRCGSLLAANFNHLWCNALNRAHRGVDIDYFAMQHDDIAPQDFWLDTLIEEMDQHGLDVLGVAAPIKDPNGLTSIALAREDGDNWRVKCRLTLSEIYRLPETFTQDDVGHPILFNTGCWVIRFDPAWRDKLHFTINDRIVFDTIADQYRPEVESEDWYFSRLCQELKLRIGITRKVVLAHRGMVDFFNTHPWGNQEFDEALLGESAVPIAAGWQFPWEVEGWLTEKEGQALADASDGKRVLEIGSYCGRSTVCIAQRAESVTCVDAFDGAGTDDPRGTYADFRDAIEKYGVAEKVTTVHPDGEIPKPKYDLAFIDGAHDLESVRADIAKSVAVLKPGGVLAFHDYREYPGQFDNRWDEGVTEAVKELFEAGGKLISRRHSLAFVLPPENVLQAVSG